MTAAEGPGRTPGAPKDPARTPRLQSVAPARGSLSRSHLGWADRRGTGPVTARVCALVSAKFAAVKLPSVPIWLAPFSVVAPDELPVIVSAVIAPPAPSLIAPAEVNVVAVPVTAPLIARSPVVVVNDVLAPPSI